MILYLDMLSGISGDMALGALVDLGVPQSFLSETLAPVLRGFSLRSEIVFPSHLRAISLHVDVTDHHTSRHYRDIRNLIETAELPAAVRKNSLAAFERIADAESRIHGKDKEHVHFHEIGGIDSMVDIIGTFLAVEYLGVERVVASSIPLGSGFVDCAHGKIPVPVPATVAILRGLPVTGSDAKTEIVTPTGAAIVATLADAFGPMPAMEIAKVGYGAGKRETGSSVPNVLRMVLGRAPERGNCGHIQRDRVMSLAANVDDLNPEILGFAMDRLFEEGALDVSFVPVTMKKNRPGIRLEVLCREEDEGRLAEVVLTETTSIGVRCQPCDRIILRRETGFIDAGEGLGRIRVKAVTLPSGRIRLVPEYEACRQKASTLKLPLKEVYDRVIAAGNPLDRDRARLYKTEDEDS